MKKILFLLLILFILVINYSYANITFSFHEIFFAEWGNEENEFGFEQSLDRNYGPASYYVTETNDIYIIDFVQQKIKVFNHSDSTLSALPFSLPRIYLLDIVVDENENLYLLDSNNTVNQYSLTGELLNTIQITQKLYNISGLNMIDNKLYATTPSDMMYLIKDGTNIISPEMQLSNSIQGRGYENNKYYRTILSNKSSGMIQQLDNSGFTTKNIYINFPENDVLTFIFVDEVDEKYYYTIVEKENPSSTYGVDRFLQIYNNSGNLVYSISIPFLYWSFLEKEFQVDDTGNIYHLLSMQEGVRLIKLKFNETIPDPDGMQPFGEPETEFFYPQEYRETEYHFNEHLLPDPEPDPEPEPSPPGEGGMGTLSVPTNEPAELVTRYEAMSIARQYRDVEWTAIAGNISAGVVNPGDGSQIRTPAWVTIGAKVSTPYKWGGWTSLEYFLTQAAAGKYTGDDYTSGDNAVSWSNNYVVGVDCSGFVSRAWRLNEKKGTSTLPPICTELTGFDDMKPGDIANKTGHVRLFKQKESNGSYTFIEAMGTYWRVVNQTYTATALSTYTPYKYNNMVEIETPNLYGFFNSSGTDITVKWETPSGGDINQIIIYLSTDGDSFTNHTSATASSGQTTISGLTAGNTYYAYAVFSNNDDLEGLNSTEYIFRVTPSNKANVLIVEDEIRFGTHKSSKYFGEPLTNANYFYDICRSTAIVDEIADLKDYWAVIWFTGRASAWGGDTALNEPERVLIKDYLDNGGNFFVTGQEIAWEANYLGGSSNTFFNAYLKSSYVSDFAQTYVVNGLSGKILEDLTFSLEDAGGSGGGAYTANSSDVINSSNSGVPISYYGTTTTKYGGMSFSGLFPDGTQEANMIYLGYSFESIKSSEHRNTVMQRIMSSFGVPEGDTAPKIAIETNYDKPAGEEFIIELIAIDDSDTASGLTWTLSDTDAEIWNEIYIVHGATNYLILNPEYTVGTDTFLLKVKDSDDNEDSVWITVTFSLVEPPDLPILLYVLNNGTGNSAELRWKHDSKAYKYEIWQSTDNWNWTHADTIYTPFTNTTINGLSNNTRYYYKIKSANSVDTYTEFSMTLGFRTTNQQTDLILIEDDFHVDTHNYKAKFVGSLNTAGKSFDAAVSESVINGTINLNNYRSVIWSCGDDTSTLNTEERDRIKSFLDNGGNLFITGNNIGTDLNSADQEFYQKYLKTGFGHTRSYRYTMQPRNWGIFNGLNEFYIWTTDDGSIQNGTSGAAYQIPNPDRTNHAVENTTYGAKSNIRYWDSGWDAGVDFTGGFGISEEGEYRETSTNLSKLVHFTFAFECINVLQDRQAIMARIIDYFDSPSVAGRINLEAIADNSGVTVSLAKSNHTDTQTYTTDELGRFRFDFLDDGEYIVQINESNYLKSQSEPFSISKGNDAFFDVWLLAGDVISDNKINIFDASYVHYYIHTGYNAAADLNEDSIVDDTDMVYIKENFGFVGN